MTYDNVFIQSSRRTVPVLYKTLSELYRFCDENDICCLQNNTYDSMTML